MHRFRALLPRAHHSPLRKAVTLGCGVALLPLLLAVGYVVYVLAVFWGAPLFWDAAAEPWQQVRVTMPADSAAADETVLIEVRRTHPVFNRFRVQISDGQHAPVELRRYPFGGWPELYVYALNASTPDSERAAIVRLANGINDHWYDLHCGCLRDETEFVPLSDERWLGVVQGSGTALQFEGVRHDTRP